MAAVEQLSAVAGRARACAALGMPRSSFYRRKQPVRPRPRRSSPARALRPEEREQVLAVLHEERFADRSPGQIYSALLDEGVYLSSPRTMYRLLAERGEVRERRNQLAHPPYQKPELLATRPNELWSWDITKLRGPVKWTYYYLYVILDVLSRYVVGWMVAERECASLAEQLIAETCEKQGIEPGQLTLHADRGGPARSKSVALLLADLGIAKSHSRPYVSDDNPFSESHFKTLKYRPSFPDRFGSLTDARAFCRHFFPWYNNEHYHSGLAMFTPRLVHYGLTETCLKVRQQVLNRAYQLHPERFVHRPPRPAEPPKEVWINPPRRPTPDEAP